MMSVVVLLLAASPGALERLADDVTARLTAEAFDGPVGLAVEAPDGVARAVSTVLCARLSSAKLSCEVLEPGGDVEERARARELGAVVRLALSRQGATVLARGDVVDTWRNFWAGERKTRGPRGLALAFVVEPDAELNLLFGPREGPAPTVPLELKLTALARWPTVPIALAAGDLDGDRKSELAVILGEELLVLSGDGKVLARADLSSGAPAPALGREPFGAVAILPSPPRVVAWSGRRARAELFAWANGALRSQGAQESITLDGFTARLEPGLNRFLPESQYAGKPVRTPAGFQAVSVRGPVMLFVWPDGTASLSRQLPPAGRLADVGCGSALADVDGDGVPEVLVSSARTSGDADELRLLPLPLAEGLAANVQSVRSAPAVWQAPLKGRALVMTGADLDGDGAEEFVFGTWLSDGSGELWLARRVTP